MVKIHLEKALWGNSQPPYVSAPHHKNHIAVEVFFDRAIYTSGSEFRCFIEMHRPALYPSVSLSNNPLSLSKGFLDFCTLQFIGVCSSTQLSSACLHEVFNAPRDSWALERNFFHTQLMTECNKIYPNCFKKSSFVPLPANNSTPLSNNLPKICYDPFSGSNHVTFLKSSPHIIFEKETFFTSLSSLHSAPHDGFECLIPPAIPPTFSGKYFSYSYFISIVVSHDRTRPGETVHILLPVCITIPKLPIHCQDFGAKFIVDPDFFSFEKTPVIYHLKNNSTVNTFSFHPHSWKGGTSLCQWKWFPPLSREGLVAMTCNLLENRSNETSVPFPMEILREMELLSLNKKKKKEVEKKKETTLSSKIPECGDQIRIFFKSHLVAEIKFMASYEQSLFSTNTHLCSLAQSTQNATPQHTLECFSNDVLFTHFDFSKATQSCIEVHLYLISEEVPQTLEANQSIPANRKIVWEEKHVVLDHMHLNVAFKISPRWPSTFSTPLVRVNYILFFHFFCFHEAGQRDMSPTTKVTELFWTIGLSISDRCAMEKRHAFCVNPLTQQATVHEHCPESFSGMSSVAERLWEIHIPPNRLYHNFIV